MRTLLLVAAVLVTACTSNGTPSLQPDCSDGTDNDDDGEADWPTDPGCSGPDDPDEHDDIFADCFDDVDNDGDGKVDYPDDPGCTSSGDDSETDDDIAQCSDGLDNDGDGYVDYPDDPGCASKLDDDEINIECGDGVDNDGDGAFDYPDDSDCGSATDPTESWRLACADGKDNDDDGYTDYPDDVDCLHDGDGSESTWGPTDCTDGWDNDGDGAVDLLDDGCSGQDDLTEVREPTVCSDGIDNDGDGAIDYPDDVGCGSIYDPDEQNEQCFDGVDNDGDGKVDFPDDPGCYYYTDSDEYNTQCEDGIDNDGDGAIDYPADDGCTATWDFDEIKPPCSDGIDNDGDGAIDYPADVGCVSIYDGDESNYQCSDGIDNDGDGAIDHPADLGCGSARDDDETNLACADGVDNDGDGAIDYPADLGCEGPDDYNEVNTACVDGIDNDGDGLIDYPNDPGCIAAADDDEDDDCAWFGDCPECFDGLDNDHDGQVDYPEDDGCYATAGAAESCASSDMTYLATDPVTTIQNPTPTDDDYGLTCNATDTADVAIAFDVPAMRALDLQFRAGSPTAMALLGPTCGTEVSCTAGSRVHVTDLPAGRYEAVVDDTYLWGDFVIAGTIASNGLCTHALFSDGAIQCPAGHTCTSTMGQPARCTPVVAQCNDGVDNNADGKTDWPLDPGCFRATDLVEDTVCPGPSCPRCSDGIDNDGDGLVDYPSDYGCQDASADVERFCSEVGDDFGGVITTAVTNGQFPEWPSDDWYKTCDTEEARGADITFALSLPVRVDTLQIDTNGTVGVDTVLQLSYADCGYELACNSDSGSASHAMLILHDVPPANYAVVVDSYVGSGEEPFLLNVHGTVASGTACTSPLFTTGVLSCASGQPCSGGVCP